MIGTIMEGFRALCGGLYYGVCGLLRFALFALLPILGIALAVLVALLVVALVRTLIRGHKDSTYAPAPEKEREEEYAKKLSEMVKIETISVFGESDPEKFRPLHAVMAREFPLVFEKLEKHDIDGNLVMYWKGKTSENPIMLMSHIDVVAPGPNWTHDPFGGEIEGGKVWGRGTVDTKCSVMAFYQAAEELLREGYVPPVDVYLCSSCTEEVGGDGAPKIVEWLKSRGVKLAMLSDEGGGIISEPIGGIPGNFAMVGVYEKGTGDLKFTARSRGGHASSPPKNSPVARLAKFVAHVENRNPMKVKFSREVEEMFSRLSVYAGFPLRFVLGNLWLFKPVLKKVLPLISPQAAAMLQTTVAFTKMRGSDGFNIIPQEAYVTANLRFIPHQKVKESVEVLTKLAEKYNIETEVVAAMDPSPSLDLNGRAFKLTEAAIARTFPGLPASPYVVTGATDCRFYNDVCASCVRFSPVIMGPEQMKGMHGIDENIESNCLPGAVDYYKNLIRMQEEF